MLFGGAETEHQIQWRIAAFHKCRQELGWTAGQNIQVVLRWGAGDPDRIHAFAAELVGLNLDLIFAANTPAVAALQKLTKTIPIVFASVGDPVDSGFVENLSRPGGTSLDSPIWITRLVESALRPSRQSRPTSSGVIRELIYCPHFLPLGGGDR